MARLRRRSNGRSAERFRLAEAIAHCGELGGVGRRGFVAERRMRATLVVVGDPSSGGGADGASLYITEPDTGHILRAATGTAGAPMYSHRP